MRRRSVDDLTIEEKQHAVWQLGQAQSSVWEVIVRHPTDKDLLDLWQRLKEAMKRYGYDWPEE